MSLALRLLNEYRNASVELDRILAQMDMLVDRLHSFARPLNPMCVSMSATTHDREAETVCELEMLTLEVGELIDLKAGAKRHVAHIIWLVREKQGGQWEQVLNLRYIKLMSWREIGAEIGQAQTSVRRWHDNAVGVIDGLLLQSGTPKC